MNNPHDYRLGHILHKGDQICADGVVYTITGAPLGFGGTSIVYPAISDSSKLEIAIKEAFPGGAARYHRCGGVIRPTDPNDVVALGQLEQYRKQLQKEMELGQAIRNSSVRAIGLWKNLVPSAITVDGKTYTEVSDGIYSILERMDRKGKTFNQLLQYISDPPSEDAPLKTGYLPQIHTTALIMEQVLLALQRVHTAGENGFLFGDIQDGNVFFSDCRLEQGDIGIGNLLDFGCARPLVDGNQTEEITDRQVFSTMGFIPPEILNPEKNNGTLCLTRSADIYSVGCLMLRCLLSPASIKLLGASPVVDDEAIDEEAASRLGCTESIRNLLNLILQKALQTEPEDRYPDTEAMLADIRKLKRDTAPPTYLLPKAPGSSASFVEGSRDEEIRRIMQALTVNTPAFLWGCGGIGKSEIAIKVAQEFENSSPKGAYFVHYTVPTDEKAEAMEETVLRMPFEGYKYEPEQPGMSLEEQRKADYRKRIGILRKEYAGALLIIDNFDWPGKTWADLTTERSYQEIISLGLNLVFTTRNEVPGTSEVKELSREDLLKLMRRWCTDSRITDQQLLDLIVAVDGHTLTVMLIAKTLEESWGDVTPEMILEALRSSRLAQADYPEVTHQALIKGQVSEQLQHRDQKSAQIYGHLKTLFDLSGMSEGAKNILFWASLTPENGMDALLFKKCLQQDEQRFLQNLVKCGWINRNEHSRLTVHPIIQEVCIGESQQLETISSKFFVELENIFFSSDYNAGIRIQIADYFARASDILDDFGGGFAFRAGSMFFELGRYTTELKYDLRALEKQQAYPYSDDMSRQSMLAEIYSHIATAYYGTGDVELALDYGLMAKEIGERSLPPISDLMGVIYNNLALYYSKTGNINNQLKLVKKALKIWEQIYERNDIRLARGYNNVGAVCFEKGHRKQGLKFSLKALHIYENCLASNSPDLALSYYNVAHIYCQLNDADYGLSFYLKAVDVLEQMNYPGHPYCAMVYSAIGIHYLESADYNSNKELYKKALDYLRKAEDSIYKNEDPDFDMAMEIYKNIMRCNIKLGIRDSIDDFSNLLWAMEFGNRKNIEILKRRNGLKSEIRHIV